MSLFARMPKNSKNFLLWDGNEVIARKIRCRAKERNCNAI